MSSDIHALSGAYAVDALDDVERAEFERHLATCEACRAEVDGLREAAASLSELSDTPAPTSLRSSVLAGITTVRPLGPVVEGAAAHAAGGSPEEVADPAEQPVSLADRRARRTRRWAAGIAAAAAVAVLGGGTAVWHPWDRGTTTVVSVADRVIHAPDARHDGQRLPNGGSVTVYRSASVGRAVVVAHDMPPAPDGKVYELWFQDDAGAMHPAGLMAGGADTTVTLKGGYRTARGAGITVEPAGGSPVPTSTPIALISFT